jgi:hypothetical protein
VPYFFALKCATREHILCNGVKGETNMAYSNLLHKSYDPSNSSVVYISNMVQCHRYLQNGAQEDLVDILYTDTKNDCLVFVFRKSPLIKDLYARWQEHNL